MHPRWRGCARAARSSSARRRYPNMAGSAPATRRSPASRATPGSSTAPPAARRAAPPRLGYVKQLHPEVEAATRQAARVFEELGAVVEEADPGFAEPYDTIMTIWGSVSSVV